MRYDDETRLYKIAGAPRGLAVLVEGVVVESAVKFRPKRQLVCSIEDDSGVLVMRFLNFYTSQMKQLAPGTRVRLYGKSATASSVLKWFIRATAWYALIPHYRKH